jgi:hypothetical protein
MAQRVWLFAVAVVIGVAALGLSLWLVTRVSALESFENTQTQSVNPGLGTVMMEYGQRFSDIWWAEKAGNWDMATYQIEEMREIQETGEVDRPARAPALKDFESKYLSALQKTITAKDGQAFLTAFSNTIGGCNGCHAAQSSSESLGGTYKFVKIQIPTAPNRTFIDFAGQK